MERRETQIWMRYDGSFAGLLCAADEISIDPRHRRETPRFFSAHNPEDLFEPAFSVETDLARARILWREAAARGYRESLTTCFEAFCSDLTGAKDALGRVLAAILRETKTSGERSGRRYNHLLDLSDPDILTTTKASERSRHQAHKITGLVRFSELPSGLWYASIHPDCDVLPLIGKHFSLRFPKMRFVIHDLRRSSAILREPGESWRIVEGLSLPGAASALDLPSSERESIVRDLWRTYFESVAIKARKNPSLQRQFMPQKYWDALPEMNPRA